MKAPFRCSAHQNSPLPKATSDDSSHADQTIDALLRHAIGGDHSALGDLLDRFRHQLRALASDLLAAELQQKVAPSDLVQETCIDALSAFDKAEIEHLNGLKAWLITLLTHNVIDWQRKFKTSQKRNLKRERSLFDHESKAQLLHATLRDERSPAAEAISRESSELLQRELNRLPRAYHQVIIWRNGDRLSWPEIAKLVNRSEDAVRMLWKRAISKLKKNLREE